METNICCPLCGHKKLKASRNSDLQARTWQCMNCGNEFLDFSFYKERIQTLHDRLRTFMIFFICIGIILTLFIFGVGSENLPSAVFWGLIVFGVFLLSAFTVKGVVDATIENLENEMNKLKDKMNNFKKSKGVLL